ncbi:MAG: peptide chain release factor N(5)-glutamine methyltransferase [Pseudomonadota bacterium]|nr:peptide chain release factor N(5)-glutamine methyltransferase [Pseudomonadota bacterium]
MPQKNLAVTLIKMAEKIFSGIGIEKPRFEARILLAHVLGIKPLDLISDPYRNCSRKQMQQFESLVNQRARRVPISHLLGRREFWSLDFRVTRDVLDPRPDSETIVAEALKRFPTKKGALSILDIGVGSGCLLLSVLHERPQASGLGTDVSQAAIDISTLNASRLGLANRVEFQCTSWVTGIKTKFDLILCNPPYIATSKIELLEMEVRTYEPRLALDGGWDGLVAYRELIPELCKILNGKGIVILEIGLGQARDVISLAEECGLTTLAQPRDLSGHIRCLVLGLQNNEDN